MKFKDLNCIKYKYNIICTKDIVCKGIYLKNLKV